MAIPNSREELIDYALRALGSPVLEINVADEQVEDRVDEALQWFREFHPDGSGRYYIRHVLTQQEIDEQRIDIGVEIQSVVRMFPVHTMGSTRGMFDIKYQMMLNDITDLNNFAGDMAYYEQMQQHLSLLDMKLTGMPEITFDRQNGIVKFYVASEKLSLGDFVIFEVYGIRDFNGGSHGDRNSLWNHKFIKTYVTALIKKQWGVNMSKFEGMQLPGGVTISGRQIMEMPILR